MAFYNGRSVFGIVSATKTKQKPAKTKTPVSTRVTKLQRTDYPDNWHQLRLEVFERDGYCCRKCSVSVRGMFDRHVHHVVPLSRGGTNKKSNLLTICGKCHRKEHL